MSEAILVTRDGPVATVVLNNPGSLNALTRAAWARLNDVMDEPPAGGSGPFLPSIADGFRRLRPSMLVSSR